MTMTRICEVHNNQLIIPMPEGYEHKTVRVVIEEMQSAYDKKVALMKQAANDPLFQADVEAITEDFKHIDHEDFGGNDSP